ncbi:YceD family protein [Proteiniborus sp. MB09-C3]|uniref:YceD family protein n=1 Tax=Proteiniborus sp. MB09-C3 TaxID=3050072 RepID=UPI002553BA4A|nr:YceD family protein [Proteiniborus sp. MB09-C3]WIV10821.1 YceD family protein [Proteiniborus sp. MB09-C3]
MKIDLSRLIDRAVYKIDFEHSLNLTKVSTKTGEIALAGPVNVKGSVYKTDENMYLDAKVSYEYYENCARCLKEFVNRVETVLSGRLMETSQLLDTDDDEFVFYYDNGEVELTEQVLTSILLSLPMKALCADNCRGLCLVCGKDLNKEECSCEIQEIDPRLAKLKDLFD